MKDQLLVRRDGLNANFWVSQESSYNSRKIIGRYVVGVMWVGGWFRLVIVYSSWFMSKLISKARCSPGVISFVYHLLRCTPKRVVFIIMSEDRSDICRTCLIDVQWCTYIYICAILLCASSIGLLLWHICLYVRWHQFDWVFSAHSHIIGRLDMLSHQFYWLESAELRHSSWKLQYFCFVNLFSL